MYVLYVVGIYNLGQHRFVFGFFGCKDCKGNYVVVVRILYILMKKKGIKFSFEVQELVEFVS